MLKRQEKRFVIVNDGKGFIVNDRCSVRINDHSGSRLNASDNRRHHQDRFEGN